MWRIACSLLLAAAGLLACAQPGPGSVPELPVHDAQAGLPELLQDTGLYFESSLRPGLIAYTPQFPLWSDGAEKRRWLYLPPGAAIDGTQPDAWSFPVGTRLWKAFAHGGRPVETRYAERLRDGSWRFATYVWNAEGTQAVLAPQRGIAALPVAGAPGGRYAVPARGDCMACHGSAPAPVLGFSAVQLSSELPGLMARGVVRGLPASWRQQPPRMAAATPLERAALGTLHGNCAHCHNTSANRVPLRLTLAQRAVDPAASRDEVLRSAVDAVARYQPAEGGGARIVAPGQPEASLLVQRMASRDPRRQMPPLGTQQIDAEGLALVRRWIAGDLHHL